MILVHKNPDDSYTEYDLDTKVATQLVNDVDENTVRLKAKWDDKIVDHLVKEEIARLENIIWNCKNSIAYSKDRPDLQDRERRRMATVNITLEYYKSHQK